jgi:hypothetical protein
MARLDRAIHEFQSYRAQNFFFEKKKQKTFAPAGLSATVPIKTNRRCIC